MQQQNNVHHPTSQSNCRTFDVKIHSRTGSSAASMSSMAAVSFSPFVSEDSTSVLPTPANCSAMMFAPLRVRQATAQRWPLSSELRSSASHPPPSAVMRNVC
jgi:hypothetical protein